MRENVFAVRVFDDHAFLELNGLCADVPTPQKGAFLCTVKPGGTVFLVTTLYSR